MYQNKKEHYGKGTLQFLNEDNSVRCELNVTKLILKPSPNEIKTMDKLDKLLENRENLNREDLLLTIKYLEILNSSYEEDIVKTYKWLKKALQTHQPFPKFWKLISRVELIFGCDRMDALALLISCTSYPMGSLGDVEEQIMKVYKKSDGDVQTAMGQTKR